MLDVAGFIAMKIQKLIDILKKYDKNMEIRLNILDYDPDSTIVFYYYDKEIKTSSIRIEDNILKICNYDEKRNPF